MEVPVAFRRLDSTCSAFEKGKKIMVQEGVSVVGFEVPRSPDSSYRNPIPGNEDEAREPPLVPPHLHHTLLNYSHSQDDPGSLIAPQNVILNHLYIENQDGPSSVVALGITHRFRSKYVTVVLYKPIGSGLGFRVESPVSPCQRNPSIYLGSYTGPYHNYHSQ
ncbi:unnamed protein product [Musa hybrid cultivar]